jgi:hypothetical protein
MAPKSLYVCVACQISKLPQARYIELLRSDPSLNWFAVIFCVITYDMLLLAKCTLAIIFLQTTDESAYDTLYTRRQLTMIFASFVAFTAVMFQVEVFRIVTPCSVKSSLCFF